MATDALVLKHQAISTQNADQLYIVLDQLHRNILYCSTQNHILKWHFEKKMPLLFNTLRPRQNGCHSADDIFKCIFLNENVQILIQFSLKFVSKGTINNIPTLVQVMALGTDQATSHYLNQ